MTGMVVVMVKDLEVVVAVFSGGSGTFFGRPCIFKSTHSVYGFRKFRDKLRASAPAATCEESLLASSNNLLLK